MPDLGAIGVGVSDDRHVNGAAPVVGASGAMTPLPGVTVVDGSSSLPPITAVTSGTGAESATITRVAPSATIARVIP